jgi:hypothetical protein
MEPRLSEARAGRRTLLFVDAAHFVLGSLLGWLWCFSRVFVRASAGRQRYNVLGALNAVTHELIHVANESYVTATTVCQLIEHIAASTWYGLSRWWLDNARYQRCAMVERLTRRLDIELSFLPAYPPNLNLIERLWRFVKNTVLNSRPHGSFSEFRLSIDQCLAAANYLPARNQTPHDAPLSNLR